MLATHAIAVDAALPERDDVCRHCGDELLESMVTTEDGAFCCAGCSAVYALIAAHGLEAFYACEVPAGVSQRRVRPRDEDYAVLDEPDAARLYVVSERDGIVRAQFVVSALHCASCVWLIEQLWRFEPGVVRAEVDMLRRTARVEYRAGACSLRTVAERLAALGYPPALETERAPGAPPHERRALYLRIGLAGFAFGNVMLFSIPRYVNGGPLDPWFQQLFNTLNLIFAIPVLMYSAAPYFRSAWHAARARTLTIDVPVALGLAVLFTRSVFDIISGRGEGFLDSFSGLVFFLLIGRLFQQNAFEGMAFDRTVRSFLPLSVRLDRGGVMVPTAIDKLASGDVMLLRHQEVVPADAVLIDASGLIDYAFATGESVPAAVPAGASVAAGGRVVGRALRMRVVRPVLQSRLVAMWNAPELARAKCSSLTDLSGRFGAWFTVAALGLAAAGAMWWWPDAGRAASVATAVLIIACPCALTLAAPITLGTAMGVLGRAGCYLKHPGVVLDLSRIDSVVFDKTGTLTMPGGGVHSGLSAADRRLVSRLAAESVHPVSRAVAARDGLVDDVHDVHDVHDVRETPGRGVIGWVDGVCVAIGSASMIAEHTCTAVPAEPGRTWVAVDGRLAGWFDLEDQPRAGVARTLRDLMSRYDTQLLSGDRPLHSEVWASLFDGHARFGLAPEDKLAAIAAERAAGRHVLMVGDGLNDAGALMAADVGLAVSDDSACFVPACDAIIRGDRVTTLPDVLKYARRARRVIVLCFAVSLVYNGVGLVLALSGALTPLVIAILMPASSLTIAGLSVGLMRRGTPRPVAA